VQCDCQSGKQLEILPANMRGVPLGATWICLPLSLPRSSHKDM